MWNSFIIKRGWRDDGAPGLIEPGARRVRSIHYTETLKEVCQLD